MTRSEQARSETTIRLEGVSKAIDQLIEVATNEQEHALVPGTSERFKSAFEELRELPAFGGKLSLADSDACYESALFVQPDGK